MGSTQARQTDAAFIGARLRQLRKQRGLTQTDLARQIDIQQSDVSRMEQGEYRVSLDNLFKMLAVFGVDASEFFGRRNAGAVTPSLAQGDMRLLQALRQLSPESRREVEEFVEFKLSKDLAEQRRTPNRGEVSSS